MRHNVKHDYALPTGQRWLSAALLLTVIFSPLPLGGNRPWAWGMLVLAVSLLACWQGVLALRYRQRYPRFYQGCCALPAALSSPLKYALLGYSMVLGWMFLQTLPIWPSSVYGDITIARLSVDPAATYGVMLRLAMYAVVFILTVLLCQHPTRAGKMLKWLGIAAALYAAYGFAVYYTGNKQLLTLPKWAYQDDLTGTFVNRNSAATFAGLGLLCMLAYTVQWLRLKQAAPYVKPLWNEPQLWLLSSGCLLIFATLLLTHSRAGLLVVMMGVVCFCLLYFRRYRRQVLVWSATGLFLILCLLKLQGSGGTLGRFLLTSVATEDRFYAWQVGTDLLADTPISGIGAGTFQWRHLPYKTLEAHGSYDKLHNDWLELLVDVGLPMGLLFFASIGLIVWQCVRGVKRRRSGRVYPALAVAASVLVGLHGLVDFSLQMPGVAVWYAAMLGVGYGQSVRSTT